MISFVFKIWVSRALGAQTVGMYQIANSVMALLFTVTSGVSTVLSRKIAEARGDLGRQNSLVTASLIVGLALSGTIVTALYLARDHLGFLFSDERCLPIFLILLPTLVTSGMYASLRSWFWGRKNFLAFSSTELLDEIVRVILSVVFAGGVVAFVSGGKGIALAATASDAVCVIALAAMFFASGGRLKKPAGFKEMTLRAIPLSATRIVTAVSASVTALVLPQMLVKGGMSVAEATAEYGRIAGMAIPLIMAPVMLVSSLSVVLLPDLAALKAAGQMDAVRKKLMSAINFAALIACVFFVLYMPLGRHIGKLMFGDAKAGEFVSNCSFLLFFIVMAQVTTPTLNSLGREKTTFVSTSIGSVVMLACTFLLTKYVGAYAMAIGSAGCFLIASAVNMAALKKEVGNFLEVDKLFKCLLFSVPLAFMGVFADRLVTAAAGEIVSMLVIGGLLVFLLFVFIHAFKIADVSSVISLLRPTHISGKLPRKGRSGRGARHKKINKKTRRGEPQRVVG